MLVSGRVIFLRGLHWPCIIHSDSGNGQDPIYWESHISFLSHRIHVWYSSYIYHKNQPNVGNHHLLKRRGNFNKTLLAGVSIVKNEHDSEGLHILLSEKRLQQHIIAQAEFKEMIFLLPMDHSSWVALRNRPWGNRRLLSSGTKGIQGSCAPLHCMSWCRSQGLKETDVEAVAHGTSNWLICELAEEKHASRMHSVNYKLISKEFVQKRPCQTP